jgi:hypothetical protein
MKSMQKWLMVLAMVAGSTALAQGALKCGPGSRLATTSDKEVLFESCVRVSDGMCQGPYRGTYKSGGNHTLGECKGGMRTGRWQYFDPQGKKTAEIDFLEGDYHGVRVEYFANGQRKFEHRYERGRLTSQKSYDQKGTLLTQGPTAPVPTVVKK